MSFDSRLAPIAIFAFNRPDLLSNLIDSLRKNTFFESSEIFFFVDGCRNENDTDAVNKVIELSRTVTDNVVASPVNKGLADSIISGVTDIVNRYGKVIVLEDDLCCMPGFLSFMNNVLNLYETDKRILSVCGYGLHIKRPAYYAGDVYLSLRSSSRGWGTWADRWNSVDWKVSDWSDFKSDAKAQKLFNKGGSDMTSMLRGYMEGRNNSWAIRFCYHQFRHGLYSIHPFDSLIANDGFGSKATNCRQKYSRFKTNLQHATTQMITPPNLKFNNQISKQLRRYHCIPIRIYSKFRKILNI